MLRNLTLILSLGLAALVSGAAQAGVFEPSASSLTIRIGSLPPIVLTAQGDSSGATLTGGTLSVNAGVWSTGSATAQGPVPGTSLFTGVPILTKLSALSFGNQSGTFASTATTYWSGWAGTVGLDGSLVLHVAGITAPVTLGNSGELASLKFVAATSGTWINDIQTRRIRLPGRSGSPTGAAITLKPTPSEVVETVTTSPVMTSVSLFESTINLTSNGEEGTITLVVPMRIEVTPGVFVPGYVAKKFSFVPEPGSLALGLSAVTTLAVIGIRRRR